MRLIVPARALSMFGDGMLSVVLLLRVYDTGVGPWGVTGLLVCEGLPLIVLIGVAGRIADGHDSRRILAVALGGQVLGCLALAGIDDLAATYALTLLVQTGQAFATPTWSALVPRVVGDAALGKVVALQQGFNMALLPIGAAVGSVLYAGAGARPVILIDAATFALLLASAFAVRTRRGGRHDGTLQTAESHTAASGLRILRADGLIWPLLVAALAMVLVAGGTNVLDVFLIRDELGMSSGWYGVTEVAFTVGAVGGSVVAGTIGSDRARVRTTLVGLLAIALGVLGFGLAPTYWLILLLCLEIGIALGVMNASFGTLFTTRTPDAMRGRVSSTVNGLMQATNVTSLVVFGAVGASLGVRNTYLVAGALSAVVVLLSAVRVLGSSRRSWHLRHAPDGDASGIRRPSESPRV